MNSDKRKNNKNSISNSNPKLSKLDNYTLKLISNIEDGKLKCPLCKEGLYDYPIYNCQSCFSIYHLDCANSLCHKIKIAGFLKYTFDCVVCNNQKMLDSILKYNCYCGKFYSEDPEKDPSLIIHGCGLTCNSNTNGIICEWPCHPGPHQTNQKVTNTNEPMSNLEISSNTEEATSVINLKGKMKLVGPSCENDTSIVYCGRNNYMGGWKLKGSKWANPFKVTEEDTNEEVCKKYEDYIRIKPDLMNSLHELVGKKLACWCVPDPCHTEVLVKLLKEQNLIK